MKRETLEQYLARSFQLGFEKPTDNPNYLGWILLKKVTPNQIVPRSDWLDPDEEKELLAKLALKRDYIRRNPYQVWVVELRRDVHESGQYETNKDYRVNEVHYFANLDEIEIFLRKYGYTLDQIKLGRDIDAP